MKLTDSVTTLQGCGPKRARALGQLGVHTIDDLLHHFPTGWVFPDDPGYTLVRGTVASVAWIGSILSCRVATECGIVPLRWYNARGVGRMITKGCGIIALGKSMGSPIVNPKFRVAPILDQLNIADLKEPTYPLVSGISSREISRLVRQALGTAGENIRRLHDPASKEEFDRAVRLEKYQELFYMQLALALRSKHRKQKSSNLLCMLTPHELKDYFPYQLTDDQHRAMQDISEDLCGYGAMNRLLQGDVGCGKTAVAAYAAMVVACNGGQTAILCPTQILAEQHYKSLNGLFKDAGLKCELVLSGPRPTGGAQFLFPDGYRPDVVIGTTAILGDLQWGNLALVVIDEQHKFGVEQRAVLQEHGNPHILMMTATPIPRTLAMTAFGDLDVSTIQEMPPGRMPVETHWIYDISEVVESDQGGISVSAVLERELSEGHQVYVVCPRIEALDDEMRAVEEVAREYAAILPDASVSALHGRMSRAEKQYVTQWWETPREYGKILVSTTVVEVGVDCPNATVMVIEGAERFGLAQLHQLRGRVGRGSDQSYCFLLSDTDSSDGRARLRAMESTNSGFDIAEQDIKLRGPGDLFSTRQHGLPDMRIADIVEDLDLLVQARKAAQAIAKNGGACTGYMEELKHRYGDTLLLGGIG